MEIAEIKLEFMLLVSQYIKLKEPWLNTVCNNLIGEILLKLEEEKNERSIKV